jgi:hypothetical protein
VITRRAQNTLADTLYERFLFWVLSVDTIDTKINRPDWDYSRWPTIEQFAVIMSFFERLQMCFNDDSNMKMIVWCNYIIRKCILICCVCYCVLLLFEIEDRDSGNSFFGL